MTAQVGRGARGRGASGARRKRARRKRARRKRARRKWDAAQVGRGRASLKFFSEKTAKSLAKIGRV